MAFDATVRSKLGRCLAPLLALMLVAAACGGSEDAPSADEAATPAVADDADDAGTDVAQEEPAPEATATPVPEPTATVVPEPTAEPAPAIEVVGLAGGPTDIPVPNPPVTEGWTVEEYSFGGTATAYATVGELSPDGFWAAEPADTADYRTRMIVRRPPAASFSGVVIVEWFNVTAGTDTAPHWGFVEEEIQRSGHAYVGVSVQEVGVNGVDESLFSGGLLDTRGLKVRDPERYGDLEHPGDAFAYDIMGQAGTVVASGGVLGELEATHLIAVGQSQSAIFLTGYLNAIHPLEPVYDGFVIHSRGAGAPSPGGDRLDFDEGVLIRTDLDVPVFQFEAETDLTILGFREARQPDTDLLVTWEVAGTGHSDTYTLASSAGLPRDPTLGSIIGCTTPLNDGPHHEALLAGLAHLVTWVVDGQRPPPGELIELDGDGEVVRDELGLAVGGVRLPTVDAPLRIVSGDPSGDEGACGLFGQTNEIPIETLQARYGDVAGYEVAVAAAAADAVAAGWLLEVDAQTMIDEELARAEALGL